VLNDLFETIHYINVNVAKLGSKAGNFLSGKREGERDRKIQGRGSETADNKNPKQSWVAQLVLNKLN
jgi:hypothetical protein